MSLKRPTLWLAAFAGLCALVLMLPLSLPIGANAWDVQVYADAARRIGLGQWPHRDFFAPAGALGYGLYAVVARLFPEGHPLLIAQWCILPLTLPLMLLAASDLAKGRLARQGGAALALTAPLLLFSALPLKGGELYPSPGFDAFGIYNRHAVQLLYVLAAGLLWLEAGWKRVALVALTMLALFGIKITGFLAGAALIAYAALSGRLSLRQLGLSLAVFAGALAALELASGLVSAYLADVATLIRMNTGALLPRILTMASLRFDVIAASLALGLALIWAQGRDMLAFLKPLRWEKLRALADTDLGWLLAVLAASAAFETQNTGSQEFIALWPVLLRILLRWQHSQARIRPVILALVAAASLPSAMHVLHRGARALASAPGYERISAPHLGAQGRWLAKPDQLKRAEVLVAHYAQHRPAYEAFAKAGELPSAILFSEYDYQIAWLLNAEQAAAALLAHEASTGRRFASLFILDFVDPFPAALNREAVRHVPIGLDAFRTFPPLNEATLAALKGADALLIPTCPVTTARNLIAERYAPALEGRPDIALTPCWRLRPRG